ncbi:MAG: proton-conducting transporter membrane subunit [Candidatus Margulisiibacteriota bacterium]
MSALLILVPIIGIIIINLPLGKFLQRLAPYFAATLFILQIGLSLVPSLPFWHTGTNLLEPFFMFSVWVDQLSFVMFLSIGLVELCSLLVGLHFLQDQPRFNFINLLLITFIGMNAMVLSADLFSLYIFLEVVAVASFILIAIKKDVLALEGAFKYFLLSAVASVMLLLSLALILLFAGSTAYPAVASALLGNSGNTLAKFAVGLFICGLLIKSGVVPFHAWVPDAYTAAPSYVSILLAGIITKIAGVYALIRLVISVFGFNPALQNSLMLLGLISIFVGALAAIPQTNFKRMLAYSSISQIGYIILGLGCGSPLAIAGAIFHFFNHATFKALLFTNAAAVEEQTGTSEMENLSGLGAKMPITGTTSVIALLSTAGIPPLSGFWSKFIIIWALWGAQQYFYAAAALLASLLTLAYFLNMQRKLFFGKLQNGLENIKEAKPLISFVAVLLAAIIIAVGLLFPLVLNRYILPANPTVIAVSNLTGISHTGELK